jgi:hypothetical protein
MISEAIDKVLSLAAVEVQQIGELAYTARPVHLVMPPDLACVSLSTLTGLVDWIQAKPDEFEPENWVLQVISHHAVALIRRQTDRYGRRAMLGKAVLDDGTPFPFGRFLDREEFVIGLQTRFVETPDLVEVVKLASTLTASTVTLAEDDGITQRTTVKQGVTLKDTVLVKGRVGLAPYRTFRELGQPTSTFIFRLQSREGQVPSCGLFEADGGSWKLDVVLAIKAWLHEQVPYIPIVA